MKVKKCRICGRELPVSYFYKRNSSRDGYRGECKECHANKSKAYYNSHKAEHRVVSRRYSIKKNYGLTEDEFSALYESQGGKCAICGKSLTKVGKEKSKVANIDHDHKTGKVRGILCQGCNLGLGGFRDNPEYLLSALFYLNKNK